MLRSLETSGPHFPLARFPRCRLEPCVWSPRITPLPCYSHRPRASSHQAVRARHPGASLWGYSNRERLYTCSVSHSTLRGGSIQAGETEALSGKSVALRPPHEGDVEKVYE